MSASQTRKAPAGERESFRHHAHVPVLGFVDHEAHRLLHPPEVIVGQLLPEVVVHDGVGKLRPAIDDVPPEDPGAPPLAQANHLHEELLRLRLGDLRRKRKLIQRLRIDPEELADLIRQSARGACRPAAWRESVQWVIHREFSAMAEVRLIQEAAHRGDVGAAMIADPADEVRRVPYRSGSEVVARAPEVLLGKQARIAPAHLLGAW